MTHPASAVALVQCLWAEGFNQSEISRATGINRSSIGEWIRHRRTPQHVAFDHAAGPCSTIDGVPRPQYAYLLGLYLGDGCLTACPRGVYKLRISCCDAYPHLMNMCEEAMLALLQNRVGRVHLQGCTELYSHSKHWICLFPQHAPGKKHLRSIVLEPWQQAIVEEHPKELLRGLVHSDGCRSLNTVRRGASHHSYWRYQFTNASADIRGIFCHACDLLGIDWRQMNARNISVARRASVEFMDTFIGPKA